MMIIVSYDVNITDKNGAKRLRRISKICLNHGQRVQNSVFECLVDYGTFLKLKKSILDEMDEEKDSVRFYLLGNNWQGHIEHYGIKNTLNLEEPLIF